MLQILRERSALIETLDPSTDFVDLGEFADLVADAYVVGLGECAHGVREFTQLRARLLQFLVLELDFRALALEAGYAACTSIDAWVRHGIGSRTSVVAALGSPAWADEEFCAMLDWIRLYNSRVDPQDQVHVMGLDSGENELGREAIWHHLAAEAPALLPKVTPALQVLGEWERQGPWGIGVVPTANPAIFDAALNTLTDYFEAEPGEQLPPESQEEWTQLRHYVAMLRMWVHGAGVTSSANLGENLIRLIENVDVDGRFVVWAHNTHLGTLMPDERPTLGDRLRNRFDGAYRPIAFEFGWGSVRGHPAGYDAKHPHTTTFEVPAPPPGSMAALLGRLHHGALVFDLTDPAVLAEFPERILMRSQRWLTDGEPDASVDINATAHWDGLIFIDAITPSVLPGPDHPLEVVHPDTEPMAAAN